MRGGRSVLWVIGVSVLAVLGITVGLAAIIGLGFLFWLAIKGLAIVAWRAIVDGIKDSLSGKNGS